MMTFLVIGLFFHRSARFSLPFSPSTPGKVENHSHCPDPHGVLAFFFFLDRGTEWPLHLFLPFLGKAQARPFFFFFCRGIERLSRDLGFCVFFRPPIEQSSWIRFGLFPPPFFPLFSRLSVSLPLDITFLPSFFFFPREMENVATPLLDHVSPLFCFSLFAR